MVAILRDGTFAIMRTCRSAVSVVGSHFADDATDLVCPSCWLWRAEHKVEEHFKAGESARRRGMSHDTASCASGYRRHGSDRETCRPQRRLWRWSRETWHVVRRLSLASDEPGCCIYRGQIQAIGGVITAALPCRRVYGPLCIPATPSALALVVPILRLVH